MLRYKLKRSGGYRQNIFLSSRYSRPEQVENPLFFEKRSEMRVRNRSRHWHIGEVSFASSETERKPDF
jgi:hypothetical protein